MGEVLVLGEHCKKIGSGATPKGGKEAYLEHGPFSLIRSQNVYNHGFEFGGLAYINEEQAEKLSNVVVESGDVLVNITGDSVARVCQVHKHALPARVNQHVAIVRPNPKAIDPAFLRYWFVAPSTQATLLGLASAGATRNALTKSMLESLEVPRLELDTQRAIANVLAALDDKIELNRRTNEALEAMAQAIFKDWFVDFGPVRRKQAGETDPSAILGGLVPAGDQATQTAALFPDAFGDNGLPEGWEERPVIDFSKKIQNGGTPKRSIDSYWLNGDIPWLTSGEVRQAIVLNAENHITQEGLNNSSAKLLPAGCILVALYGATAGQVSFNATPMTTNQAVCAITPMEQFQFYVLSSLRTAESRFENSAVGSAQQNISKGIVESLVILAPTKKLITTFNQLVEPFFELIVSNLEQNQTLAQTRDYLLPKLMSGEIRADNTESQVA